jgi:hypothetical protein
MCEVKNNEQQTIVAYFRDITQGRRFLFLISTGYLPHIIQKCHDLRSIFLSQNFGAYKLAFY